jgi:uroporphyrinogen-III decarboxylase
MGLGAFTAPPIVESLRAFARAAEAAAEGTAEMARNTERMGAIGFPPNILAGAILEAPFDLLSDTLRGMRGIMLDMYQRPDKLLAAEEKVSRFMLEHAIGFSRVTGLKAAFIPLHRGSDGFMSLKQFEKFYWPQLKHVLLTLVDNGIRPILFYEGTWDQRLEYLRELPKGKTAGWFQSSDIYKVKETVGDVMCIIGGMPNSLLIGGTVKEVREHTQRICRDIGKGGGFIISTCVGEMLGSKPDLVQAWVDAVKEFGEY